MADSVNLRDAKEQFRQAAAQLRECSSHLPAKGLLIPLGIAAVTAMVTMPSLRKKAIGVLRWAAQQIRDFRAAHPTKPKYMVTNRETYDELRQTIKQAERELREARARLKACKC